MLSACWDLKEEDFQADTLQKEVDDMRKDEAYTSFGSRLYAEGVTCGGDIVECEANKVSNGICNEGL